MFLHTNNGSSGTKRERTMVTVVLQRRKESEQKACVSRFELSEPKEARAPIKFVQKRDFLLPRRKESQPKWHGDGPRGTGSHSTLPTGRSGPSNAAGARTLPRKGAAAFSISYFHAKCRTFLFFLSLFPPMEWIHSHCPTIITRDSNEENETADEGNAKRMDGNGTRRTTLAVAGAVGGDGQVPEWWRAAAC